MNLFHKIEVEVVRRGFDKNACNTVFFVVVINLLKTAHIYFTIY